MISQETATKIRQFVELVRDNLIKLPYPEDYKISHHWRTDLDKLMVQSAYANAQQIVNLGMFENYFGNHLIRNPVNYQIRKDIENQYPELQPIGETFLADFDSSFTFPYKDIRSSPSVESAFADYADIKKTVGKHKIETVLELGGGFGRLARVMHLTGVKTYIIVDIPEALIFSYAFLTANFPDAKSYIITNASDMKINDDERFVFCPVQLFHSLKVENLDLFISTYTLGEIPQKSIDYLIPIIEKLAPKFFYSQDYILTNKTVHFDAGNYESNNVTLNLSPMWFPYLFNLDSQFTSAARDSHRFIGHIGLVRVEGDAILYLKKKLEEINNLQALDSLEETMKYLYFLALWNNDYIDLFMNVLSKLLFKYNTNIDINKIGEVKYLKERILANPHG
jgi:putative sugar O-methyltransferase